VAVLWRSLVKHGFNATALHGDMDQRARIASLDSFRAGDTTILVASDVAARGLDIPEVSHVFNYDVPHHAEDYIHRIGRTGRAGRSGTAVTLVSSADTRSLGAIEKLTGVSIDWITAPVAAEAASDRPARGARGERGERSERGKGRGGRGARSAEPAAKPHSRNERKTTEEKAKPTPRPASVTARPRRAETAAEPDEGLFLPAFLLRPTRIKAE
jgi:superfamily II DNA/RNA helicase